MTMSVGSAPSGMPTAGSASQLGNILDAAQAGLSAGKNISKYYGKYKKIVEYVQGLRDSDTRSVTVLQMTLDSAVFTLSKLLGKNAGPYLSLFAGYANIAFKFFRMNEKAKAAINFLEECRKLSDREIPKMTKSLEDYRIEGNLYNEMVEAGNAYILGLWLSRGTFAAEAIKKHPKAALEAAFALNGAYHKLENSRDPINTLLAMMAHCEQIRVKIRSNYDEYHKRVELLRKSNGIFTKSFGVILQSKLEIEHYYRTMDGSDLSKNSLTRSIDEFAGKVESLVMKWIERDEIIEVGILNMVRSR